MGKLQDIVILIVFVGAKPFLMSLDQPKISAQFNNKIEYEYVWDEVMTDNCAVRAV